MIGPAAAMASAEGVGCLAVGWGAWLQGWGASCRVDWPPVRLEGCCSPPSLAFVRKGEAKAARQFAREGKGEQSDAAISAGLIHENQPTVCKGTAFSWNKYQK